MQVDVRTGLGILCDFVWFIYESSHIYSSKSFIAVERIHLKPSATRKTAVDKLKKLCVRRIIQISSTPACLQVVLHQKDSYKPPVVRLCFGNTSSNKYDPIEHYERIYSLNLIAACNAWLSQRTSTCLTCPWAKGRMPEIPGVFWCILLLDASRKSLCTSFTRFVEPEGRISHG